MVDKQARSEENLGYDKNLDRSTDIVNYTTRCLSEDILEHVELDSENYKISFTLQSASSGRSYQVEATGDEFIALRKGGIVGHFENLLIERLKKKGIANPLKVPDEQ